MKSRNESNTHEIYNENNINEISQTEMKWVTWMKKDHELDYNW